MVSSVANSKQGASGRGESCHAACAAYGREDGASTVGNLRDRRDRGSSLRRVDLKRWVDAPISCRECLRSATSAEQASRRSIGSNHLKKIEPETNFFYEHSHHVHSEECMTTCVYRHVSYTLYRSHTLERERRLDRHRGASAAAASRQSNAATPAVPAVPPTTVAAGAGPPRPLRLIDLITRPAGPSLSVPERGGIGAGGGGRQRRPADLGEGGPGCFSFARGRRATKQSAMRRG